VKPNAHVALCLVSLALVLGLVGCATPRVDWSTRVGDYTYDQAVLEMGPPERHARLTDGSVVAEWLESRGLRSSYISGGFGYHGHHHSPWGYYAGPGFIAETQAPDTFIRLTFDKDGKLVTWKHVSR
jgi:hypothetical protein